MPKYAMSPVSHLSISFLGRLVQKQPGPLWLPWLLYDNQSPIDDVYPHLDTKNQAPQPTIYQNGKCNKVERTHANLDSGSIIKRNAC